MLARLALRIATLEALRPSSALPNGPFPTSAGPLVYDSLEAPINDLSPDERKPTISVYTEEANADPGEKAGGPPFKWTVTLLFDIGVAQIGKEEDGSYFPGTPSTDAEAEATLDLIEEQIKFALCYAPTGRAWRKYLTGRRITDIDSLPHRTSEEGVRLARRAMRMKVVIQDFDIVPAPATAPAGLDRLPDPFQALLQMFPGSSYAQAIAAGVANDAPVMPTAVPLNEIALTVDETG